MTEEQEVERVREEIAKICHMRERGDCFVLGGSYPCGDNPDCNLCGADQILSIKGVAILHPDQSLPNLGEISIWARIIKEEK